MFMAEGQCSKCIGYSVSMARGIVDCKQQGRPGSEGCTKVAFREPGGRSRRQICAAKQQQKESTSDKLVGSRQANDCGLRAAERAAESSGEQDKAAGIADGARAAGALCCAGRVLLATTSDYCWTWARMHVRACRLLCLGLSAGCLRGGARLRCVALAGVSAGLGRRSSGERWSTAGGGLAGRGAVVVGICYRRGICRRA